MSGQVTLPYRPCVGIALFNTVGEVFVGQRTGGNEQFANDDAWQMPQGGIDKGEIPLDAARRELWEETNVRSAILLGEAPDWIYYDLPTPLVGKAWKGKYRGQKQRWFAFRFTGEENEINIASPGDGHRPEFRAWRWTGLHTVPAMIVPFKRDAYEQVVRAFAHLVAP